MLRRAVSLWALSLIATPAAAQRFKLADVTDAAVDSFLTALQRAVRANDPAAVWKISGGFRVNWPDSIQIISTEPQLRANYQRVFTPELRAVILRQTLDSLFATWQGVATFRGELWFRPSCPDAACRPPGPVQLQVVNEPGGNGFFHRPRPPLAADFLPTGTWWPDSVQCGYICSDENAADSAYWWSHGLYFGSDSVELGPRRCAGPYYHKEEEPGDSFYVNEKYWPHELGLNDSAVVLIEITCGDSERPRARLLVQDSTRMWLVAGGQILLRPRRTPHSR